MVACAVTNMDDMEEQLKVLQLQLEQSMAQTTEAQQDKAAAESEWQAQKAHLEEELARSHQSGNWEPAAAAPQRIYVQRERRMPKLGGRPQKPEDPDVDDWTADMENHLQASPLSDREGLDFVMDHLTGPAGQEVRFREPRTAVEALQIVRSVFGDVDTMGAAQEAFYTRIQQPGETLLDYSLALVKLFSKLSKRQPSLSPLRNETLKGRFASGVRDISLQREMRRLELDDSRMSFWEFRDRAISWIGRELPKKMATHDAMSTTIGREPDNATILKKLDAQQHQLQRMQEVLTKQQQQLEGVRSSRSWESRRSSKRGYNAEGKRVCYVCGAMDHISPNCPKKGSTGKPGN